MAITLKDIQKLDSGARFYTADLHIHTFSASADVKDAGMTVENVIDASVAQGISLIAITDHNSDKNLQRATEYAQKYSGQLLVIPGVEITTAHGHLLAYFPPDKATSVRDLLARISIVGEYGGRESHTTQSMATVIGEVERLGGISIAAHIDRQKTGFETAIAGYPNPKKDILVSSGLYGLEFDDAAHLIWYSLEDEPTPDGAERKKLLNARQQLTATAARLRLASVQNSDAHSVSQLTAKRILTRFKMNELSFDGLRMALIDPEARVRAVATIPPAFPRILGMHTAGGFLDGQTFCFSDNLNCFIGGRGTGKSTAIQSLAYGLGVIDVLEELDNCPDDVVIYCEDTNGVLYRYERPRRFPPTVRAKEDQSIKDVPADAFRVEFYGQGDLAEVAKNPLKHPALLQEFLDRHIAIKDLNDRQQEILDELSQNSAQIMPLAAAAGQLPSKKKALADLDVKLKVAETGKVKEIAAFQITLAAEKTVSAALAKISKEYAAGLSLANFLRDYSTIVASAGTLTDDAECQKQLQRAKAVLDTANDFLRAQQQTINVRLKELGMDITSPVQELNKRHSEFDQQINERMADLRKKGLSGSLDELNRLIRQRTALALEVTKLEADGPQLLALESRRTELLNDLTDVRDKIMERRKGQLSSINKNLGATIKDYAVNIYYDPSGICDEFRAEILAVMHGTYLQEDVVDSLCSAITPQELAKAVSKGQPDDITKKTGLAQTWSRLIVQRFQVLTQLHQLQTIWKPPRPVIKVLTKGAQIKQIPVNQLSDGQKHTILLTIAMLAESNLPLVIDQPEDDLDNAFVFSSVVSNLRSIKERRQVVLVTHNANIAVLGDSELLFPMKRSGDNGTVVDRGSVDRQETKKAVQDILEGGELAFRRRKEIYGH